GKQVAGIGNGMGLFLLIGGIYLLVIRQITWHIPVSFLLGSFGTALIFHQMNPEQFATPLFHILSGSTFLGAFFLATEHTTSPVNRIPMFLYGLLGGILLIIIRSFSVYYDGIAFTILLMNLFNPLLDRITPGVSGLEEVSHA
ncbi:MAG: electron transporter RnfD, partial [Calditrichaeota bacterium]